MGGSPKFLSHRSKYNNAEPTKKTAEKGNPH